MYTTLLSILSFMNTTLYQQTEAKKEYPHATVTVDIQSKKSLQQTFEYVVPMDLEHIFEPYKNIPGVDSSNNKKPWYTPGMKRTVYFDDGTLAEETLLSLTPHKNFTYCVNGFTGPLRLFIKQINGSWHFIPQENGIIRIEWTYAFIPKNAAAKWIVNTVLKKRVITPMTNALTILKTELESGNLYRYQRSVGNW